MKLADWPMTNVVRLTGLVFVGFALLLDVVTKWELSEMWALLLAGLVATGAANHVLKRWTTKPDLMNEDRPRA